MVFLNKLTRLIEWVLVVMLGLMAILVFSNVVLRYVFNSGIVFSEEVSRFMFMWLTLIGALLVMKDRAHLGMNTVINLFGERGRRVCRFLADTLTLICCSLLAHGTYKQVIIGMGELSAVTNTPLGIVQSSLLISSVGMVMFLAYSLFRLLTGRMKAGELVSSSGRSGE